MNSSAPPGTEVARVPAGLKNWVDVDEDEDVVIVGGLLASTSQQQREKEEGSTSSTSRVKGKGKAHPEAAPKHDGCGTGVKRPKAAPKPVMDMKMPHTIGIDLISIGCPETCGYVECGASDAQLFYIVPTSSAFHFAVSIAQRIINRKHFEIASDNLLELSIPSSNGDEDRWIIAKVEARDEGVQALAGSFTIGLLPVPNEGLLEVAFRISIPEKAIWQSARRPEITKFCSVVRSMAPKVAWATFSSPQHSAGVDLALSREYEEHYSRRGTSEGQLPQQGASSSSAMLVTSTNGASEKPRQERTARSTSGPHGPQLSEQAIDSFFKRPAAMSGPSSKRSHSPSSSPKAKKARTSPSVVPASSQAKATTAEERKAALLAAWESAEREIDEECDQAIAEATVRAEKATAKVEATKQRELAEVEASREARKAALLSKLHA